MKAPMLGAAATTRGGLRFLIALLPPLVAFAAQWALRDLLQPHVWFLFYPAVFLSSWIGGLRAGVLATAFAVACVWWFFVAPVHELVKPAGQYLPAAVFSATGLLFGVFHDRLRKANGSIAGALSATERAYEEARRMNRRLEQSNERIASLVEQAPEGIFVADLDGRYTEVNTAGCAMLGYTRAEILGKSIVDLIPTDDVARLWREREHLLGGEIEVTEWALRRKDGSRVPVEVSAKILSDGRWQAVVRDLSTRKQLQAALVASHADLQLAQAVAKVGSWRLDVLRDELRWSDECYRIFGIAPGTPMTYEAFLACVHPDDRGYVDAKWTAALRGQPYDIEHRVIADDTVKWVREKADLEFDGHGTLVGGIGITQDITERKRHEEQLHEAQERIELALRGADLAAWDWNVESGDVVFSARWAEMRGFRPDEIAGHVQTWLSGIHPDDRARVQQVLDDYFAGRTADYEVEHRARTKSGRWIWILDRGKVFTRDEHGRPLRMVGTELDITARKRAEEALRIAEARSSGILAISVDAIVSIDDDQRITMFNEGAERMFGYTRAEAIGAPLEMLMPERFRARHRGHVRAFGDSADTARQMGDRRQGVCGRRKDGDEFPAEAAISKLEVDGKRIFTAAVRDMTEQRRAENEQRFLAEIGPVLASSLDYQETLTKVAELAVRDIADFCIVEIVDDGDELRRIEVAAHDPAKAELAAWLKQVPLDRRQHYLLHAVLDQRRPVLIPRVQPATIASFAQSEEHLHALQAAEIRSMVAVPLVARSRLLGAIALTSSKPSRSYGPADLRLAEELGHRAALSILNARLYRAAGRATQARDDVLGIVAHDLRNPLNSIMLQVAALRRRKCEPERLDRGVAVIDRAATRMSRLIQDLLDVTRMEVGRLHVEPGALAPDRLVLDAVEAQKALATAAALELRTDLADELPPIWADRDRLLQVLENLIGNALKFTKRGGIVTIGARPGDDDVRFWVDDTGCGIPPEELPHVFDPFWQARATRKLGAGLGLPIAKGLVEAQCGRIWVESIVGRGTTFFFTIPTVRAMEEWRSDSAQADA